MPTHLRRDSTVETNFPNSLLKFQKNVTIIKESHMALEVALTRKKTLDTCEHEISIKNVWMDGQKITS